jgi:membrane AbrB-like protein
MSNRLNLVWRTTATLVVAWLAAQLCVVLGTPLPWMIGPLVVTALCSICGAPTASGMVLRNCGQWAMGTALGLYFTPYVVGVVGQLWWAIVIGIVWALLLGWLFGVWLARRAGPRLPQVSSQQMQATAYFAGAIGAASEMTLLSERVHARTDLVAAAHSLRMLIVTLTIPFALQWWGVQPLPDLMPAGIRSVNYGGLALLLAFTLCGVGVMLRSGRPNPWFLGALGVSAGLTALGIDLSALPQAWVQAAQLVIGVSLGVRFRRDFLHTAPQWLGLVGLGTFGLMGLCAGFAALLAWATGMPWVTLVLSTSPGGIAEMAITAKVLQLGVPVVTAFQVCRLIAVLLLVAPLFQWIQSRTGLGNDVGPPPKSNAPN